MTDADDRAYAQHVDRRLRSLHEGGARSWGALLAGARGADPVLLARRVKALDLDVSWDEPVWSAPTTLTPELHPLRSEWYFTAPCAARLADRFGSRTMACLGAPTVAAHAGATLVDHDATRIRARFGAAMSVVQADLATALTLPLPVAPDTIVLDPPWYPPHPSRWLALAAHAVRPGGTVAMVLPPPLQRPSAPRQRATAVACARALGATTVEPDAVRYQTPLFEVLALRAAGLTVPAAWRAADLLVVQVDAPGPPPVAVPPTDTTPEAFTIGTQTVTLSPRVRPGPTAVQPVAGTQDFRWDRVSMRDPRVPTIDLWTSRSRVATVHGHAAVRHVLQRLERGDPLSEATADPVLATALATVLELPAR